MNSEELQEFAGAPMLLTRTGKYILNVDIDYCIILHLRKGMVPTHTQVLRMLKKLLREPNYEDFIHVNDIEYSKHRELANAIAADLFPFLDTYGNN